MLHRGLCDISNEMKPTILIAATAHWPSMARLGMALANAGCTIEAVCPPRHPLGETSAVRRLHSYHGLAPLMSIKYAIAGAQPDFVVPGDDLAARHLHDLYHRELVHGGMRNPICKLIERSLGAPESFPVVYARATFAGLAQEEGVRVPRTEVITNANDLSSWVARMGLPTVLKTNGTSGGEGVRIIHTLEEAYSAFHSLQSRPLLARAAKRALVNHDRTLVWPAISRRRSVINAQAFVTGSDATTAIACWKGTVLATLHFEVLNKRSSTGPSSVVRLIENSEMSAATEKIVHRLHLSGLYGFDFMLEAETRNAHLIEVNPRATQVGHLTLGPGRDLPAALSAAISGQPVREAPKVTDNDTIALFPQEWMSNPSSRFLQSGYHDIPWEEPALVRACICGIQKGSAPRSRQRAVQVLLKGKGAFTLNAVPTPERHAAGWITTHDKS